MELSDLSPELQEKARECNSIEELKELCMSGGMKLSDEELDSIAGGIMATCASRVNLCRLL